MFLGSNFWGKKNPNCVMRKYTEFWVTLCNYTEFCETE